MIEMKHSRRLHNSMWPLSYRFAVFSWIFVLILVKFCGYIDGCFMNTTNNYGKTYPTGDIVLHVGQPLEIYCSIYLEKAKAENFSVENLVFEKDGQLVDSRYITRVNESTIRLYMENQQESSQMYYCYLIKNKISESASISSSSSNPISSLEMPTSTASDLTQHRVLVCMNIVAVGQEPREVENFTCISLNWQQLNCSWIAPKNFVKTTYTIHYYPKHRYSELAHCPSEDDINHNFCLWTLNSKPGYRKNLDVLKINLTGTNKFKTNNQTFTFFHYSHILLDGPKDLKARAKNTTSITLQWRIGDLQYFPKPLDYKILYTFRNDSDWDLFLCKNVNRERDLIWCTVPNLIPNSLYNFRVFMKSSIASEKYWSTNYAYQVFRTNSSPPARSPLTDVGSFQIEHNGAHQATRTVYVYWEPLMAAEHCGDNFHYDITAFVVNDDNTEYIASNIKLIGSIEYSFAKYEIGFFRYRFEIWAANKEGRAPNATSVFVPAASEEVEPCSSFSKTDYGQNVYEVSWQPPDSNPNIENYTIFWCRTEKERPYQCNGYTQWEHFPASITKRNFSINSSDSYQFAISANTNRSSSGMLWATCTVLHGHLGTVRQVYQKEVGSTYIIVSWKLECWDQASTIHGFVVTYCPVSGHNETKCTSLEHSNRWYGDAHLTKGNITGLRPYTYYRVSIRMFIADHKEGPSSLPVILRTSDGPPDVNGLQPRLISRTADSVTIGWEVPRQMNGVLDHYRVLWHQEQEQEPAWMDTTTTQATITKLDPYSQYNVTVKACTSQCSLMKPIVVRTCIGKPGMPKGATIEPSDVGGEQGSVVKWNPPDQLAGPHPYYEVRLFKDNQQLSVNVTNDTQIWMKIPVCNSDHGAELYSVKVRAINTDTEVDPAKGTVAPLIHEGEWSPVYAQNCKNDGISIVWKILGFTTAPVFLILSLIYGGRTCYHKCRQMKNVQVSIPMKFVLSPSSIPCDLKGHDMFENNYTMVPPLRPADEFSTLVERTADQPV